MCVGSISSCNIVCIAVDIAFRVFSHGCCTTSLTRACANLSEPPPESMVRPTHNIPLNENPSSILSPLPIFPPLFNRSSIELLIKSEESLGHYYIEQWSHFKRGIANKSSRTAKARNFWWLLLAPFALLLPFYRPFTKMWACWTHSLMLDPSTEPHPSGGGLRSFWHSTLNYF